ncbi:MAG: hypothetical protein AB8I08_38295 [Sandaracinaceae bacterium]
MNSAVLLLSSLAMSLLASVSCAQADAPTPDVGELRAEARRATAEGRLEDAYRALTQAVEVSDEPDLILQLAEAAGHLRLDTVALRMYRAYLEAMPSAPRHREIAGRVDALARARAGRAYGAEPGPTENYVVDWQGNPILRRPRADAPFTELVNWDGIPLQARSSRSDNNGVGLAARLARPY